MEYDMLDDMEYDMLDDLIITNPDPDNLEYDIADDLVVLTEALFLEQQQGHGQGQGHGKGQGHAQGPGEQPGPALGAQQQQTHTQTPPQQPDEQLKLEAKKCASRFLRSITREHLQQSTPGGDLDETYREHKAKSCRICTIKGVGVKKDELGWKIGIAIVGEENLVAVIRGLRVVKDGKRWQVVSCSG
ncbi:hypothetical protein QBC32DRAFT_317165 [Pseudoneurospora amorphoporcata]|uniref:Uncharacterized protein n=1 Tax=Pseudoneurospora amorphoporcata TaxID=241081 RepID=A0AAN6NRW7_9PEZI|nr:hypothetical protein QBC32DRAFT_317165 [Pseudoneurospora amorphoporcata]